MTRAMRGGALRRTALAGIGLLWLVAAPALALEAPGSSLSRVDVQTRRDLVRRANELGNQRVAPGLAHRLTSLLRRIELREQGLGDEELARALPAPDAPGMRSTGTVRVLALLIAFQDYPPGDTLGVEAIRARLFGDGAGGSFPYESLSSYYARSSYGQLKLEGDVLGWYTAPYARAAVEESAGGRERLIAEALRHYDALGHDFSQYDNDGDGTIDYLVVMWTGPSGAWATFWWGFYMTYADPTLVLDGKRLSGFSWQWACPSWGEGCSFDPLVVIHETGHALGLPDLYDYDASVGPGGGAGGLDVMDSGERGDHNAFSKILLGWIDPVAYTSGRHAVSAPASGAEPFAVLLYERGEEVGAFSEFFVVQNRYRTGNDSTLPGDGLLIWHVDAHQDAAGNFLFNNQYTARKLVRLMEADGLEEVERGVELWDPADFWTGGQTFGPSTTPSSAYYDGSPGPVVTGIGAPGPVQTFVTSLRKK